MTMQNSITQPKPTVYIETTIVSYLTAWPSRDLVRLSQQIQTREWWENELHRFSAYSSQLVLIEAAAGDAAAAKERIDILNQLPILQIDAAATELADALIRGGAVPPKASRDALHIGICATNGLSFLLTWNFRHLANAQMQEKIRETCEAKGYKPPIICSPDALFEEKP